MPLKLIHQAILLIKGHVVSTFQLYVYNNILLMCYFKILVSSWTYLVYSLPFKKKKN